MSRRLWGVGVGRGGIGKERILDYCFCFFKLESDRSNSPIYTMDQPFVWAQSHPMQAGFGIIGTIALVAIVFFVGWLVGISLHGWRMGDYWRGKRGFFGQRRSASRYSSAAAAESGRPLARWWNYGPPAKI